MAFNPQRGDTLVEVLMSIVILSVIIVGAITMMTRGLQAAQVSLEHTQVSFQANGQIELLHYLRDSYLQSSSGTPGTAWLNITNNYADTNLSTYGNCAVSPSKVGRAFFLTRPVAGDVQVATYNPNVPATFATPGSGLWIEATRSSGIAEAYVDFQVRGCWIGPGGSGNQQTISTVRLYDPAH